MPRLVFAIISLTPFVFTGCKQDLVIPSYLHIEAVGVTSDYSTQGSASSKVVDAWIFVDDNAQGVYELPATIPIPLAGDHEISILAGVLKDGKSVERIAYPFYSLFTQDVQLTKAQIDTVVPTVGYSGSTTFLVIEDFDAGTTGFGMNISTVDSLVFEGNGSGAVALNLATTTVTTESDWYVLPSDGSRVFLELNYRNNTHFNILLQDSKTIQDHYIITITPRTLWNKVYVDLTVPVNRYAATQYRIKFRSELPDSVNHAVNYWDNIKNSLHL